MLKSKSDELSKLAARIRNTFFREVEAALVRLLIADTPIAQLEIHEDPNTPDKKTVWSQSLNRGYILQIVWPDLSSHEKLPDLRHLVDITCTETFTPPLTPQGCITIHHFDKQP